MEPRGYRHPLNQEGPVPDTTSSPVDTSSVEEQELVIDGQKYTVDDLTFREHREMRKAIRDALEDPDADLGDAPISEFYLALIFIIRRRENAELTIEDALDWKLNDFLRPVSQNGHSPDPTKSARKPAKS